MSLPPEQLLAEIEDCLRTMPDRGTWGHGDEHISAWLGRIVTLLKRWDSVQGTLAQIAVTQIHSGMAVPHDKGVKQLTALIQEARADLRLTVGAVSVAVEQGAYFDYFEQVRKVVTQAAEDLLFVDPYLDAEFVSRYLPQIGKGATIRLLTSKRVEALVPAVEAFAQQHGVQIEVRARPNLHDRYVFVDRAACYLSGASFKDGAKKSPTVMTQIMDAFGPMQEMYERLWDSAEVVYKA